MRDVKEGMGEVVATDRGHLIEGKPWWKTLDGAFLVMTPGDGLPGGDEGALELTRAQVPLDSRRQGIGQWQINPPSRRPGGLASPRARAPPSSADRNNHRSTPSMRGPSDGDSLSSTAMLTACQNTHRR